MHANQNDQDEDANIVGNIKKRNRSIGTIFSSVCFWVLLLGEHRWLTIMWVS